MDLFARLLLYMSRWSRRRPGWQLFLGVCITLALIGVVVGIEHFVGWPEALTVNRLPRTPTMAR
jgi:hypothetical protein